MFLFFILLKWNLKSSVGTQVSELDIQFIKMGNAAVTTNNY